MNKKPASANEPEYFIQPDSNTEKALLESYTINDEDLRHIKNIRNKEHRVFCVSLELIQDLGDRQKTQDWISFEVFRRSHPDAQAIKVPRREWRCHRLSTQDTAELLKAKNFLGTVR